MLLSKIPIKMYLRGLRPLFFIACFTVILNLFYTGGDVIFSFWIITITKQENRKRGVYAYENNDARYRHVDAYYIYHVSDSFDKWLGKTAFSFESDKSAGS